jgi:hypothetical protein
LYGDFKQKNGSGWDNSAGIDFSMKMGDNGTNNGTAYDLNGNILRMQQWGLKAGSLLQTDDLQYAYTANSNKLKSVTDQVTAATGLGDFTDKNTTGDDYGYDVNGNLTADKNKRLNGSTGIDIPENAGAILYNHLNLPWQITVQDDNGNAKGTITYIYDGPVTSWRSRPLNWLPLPITTRRSGRRPPTWAGMCTRTTCCSSSGTKRGGYVRCPVVPPYRMRSIICSKTTWAM